VRRLDAGKGRSGYISRAFQNSSAACAVLADATVERYNYFPVGEGGRRLLSYIGQDSPVEESAFSPY
jgi:hypothetical protein